MAGGQDWLLAATVALLWAFTAAQEGVAACGVCDESSCPAVDQCAAGVVMDACDCCSVCARGLGQLCDLGVGVGVEEEGAGVFGVCGEYLMCAARTDIQGSTEATCQCKERGEVCGSDKVTYPTLCDLLAQAHVTPDLQMAVRGPCMSAPTIRSRPEDHSRPLGSILVLDCEASGNPVPAITWRLSKLDGSSMELPGDDPSFAVQIRGGPEPNMVTGWVQIMKITPDTLGIYTCQAKNTEGKAQASAAVTEMVKGSKNGNRI